MVDQKLFSAGNRVIDFAAVVNVHVHDFLVAVEMGESECVGAHAVRDGFFAGCTAIHRFSVLTIRAAAAAVF